MAPGFVPMANALSLPSNALLQANSPWRIDRVFPERLLNSKSPCARQSLNTPRDFLHAKHDPTQHDTQDVRRLLRGPSKSPEDSNWTVRIAHSLTSCAPFPCQSGMMTGPSCQVLTCHNTRNVVLILLVLSMVCHIKPCWCRAMPRLCSTDALPDAHHVTSNLAMSRLRLEFVRRLRSATQVSRCPWREN